MHARTNPRRASSEPVLAATLMSPCPVTVGARMEAHRAARIAMRHGVHHLLVVDDQELLGVACLCDLTNASSVSHIGDLVHSPIVFINSSATAEAGVQVMRDSGVGCLPVIAPSGAVVGVLTRHDLRSAGFLPDERGVDLCASCGTGHHLRVRSGSDGPLFCSACLEGLPRAAASDAYYFTLGGSE